MDGMTKLVLDMSRPVATASGVSGGLAPTLLTGTPGTTTFVAGVTSVHSYASLSAAATSKLPATPTAGDTYTVKIEDATSAAQGVTINGNGHNVESATAPGTLAATFVASAVGSYTYMFDDGAWRLV